MYGFIGLGSMGLPIAMNLLKTGHRPLRVYNRTAQKAAPLLEGGAEKASTPRDAVVPGGIVFTMLSDDRAVEEVVLGDDGIAGRLGQDGIHVSMSTISPETARRLSEKHREYGSAFVSAPVFGRPEAAAAAKLWICLSGPRAAKTRVEPILRHLGQAVYDFGDDPGAACVVKLSGNFLISAAMEAMAEALVFAEKNNVDRVSLIDMLSETIFACPIYRNYGKAIAERRFEPVGFRLALGFKDVDLVLKTAIASRTPMPTVSVVHNRLMSAMAKGRGEMDWMALALGVAEDAGIENDKR